MKTATPARETAINGHSTENTGTVYQYCVRAMGQPITIPFPLEMTIAFWFETPISSVGSISLQNGTRKMGFSHFVATSLK